MARLESEHEKPQKKTRGKERPSKVVITPEDDDPPKKPKPSPSPPSPPPKPKS